LPAEPNLASVRIADIEGNPLIDSIKTAFADDEQPGPGQIAASSWAYGEAQEEFEQLCGRCWLDLELGEMPSLVPALMWFSPRGFRYYFPAFLAWALVQPNMLGSLDFTYMLAAPNRSGEPDSKRGFRMLTGSLTPEQKSLVGQCLKQLGVRLEGPYAYWGGE
jgi:hypothetical protein